MSFANYGWIIDIDHQPLKDSAPGTNGNAIGMIGPRAINPIIAEQLKATPQKGIEFRMYDDDEELYYTGRIIVEGVDEKEVNMGEEFFAPLDDFGSPNAGATTIQYKDENGEWSTL